MAGMRLAVIVAFLLSACVEHGKGGGMPGSDDPSDPPDHCGCIADSPPGSFEECCNSVVCSFNDETNQWDVTFCDPPPPDPCEQCGIGTGEICVQRFDGACGFSTTCEVQTVECPDNACSAECEAAYCGEPFQCQNRVACGPESPMAFTCYGP
jgi:hypothetical protein